MFSNSLKMRIFFDKLVIPVVILYLLTILFPILSILRVSSFSALTNLLEQENVIMAIKTSLSTTIFTLFLTFFLGTSVVFVMKHYENNILFKAFDIIIGIPVVFPPTVAGMALLLAFGRNGVIGSMAYKFNIEIVFTPFSVILAQLFVSSAFYIKIFKDAVDRVSPEIFEASYVFGASKTQAFIKIIIPMLKKSIISGLILSWMRALGEFGATLMFAGNIAGKTRTIPLEIYTLMQTDIATAGSLSLLLMLVCFAALCLVRVFNAV